MLYTIGKIHSLLSRANRRRLLLTILGGSFILSAVTPALTLAQHAAPEDIEAGRRLYERWCAQCHGLEGRGDGPAAPLQYPRPRDFTRGLYKIRSTLSGELPTDEDIFKVITEGMPNSPMPGWDNLSERERWQLVYYIKTFSRRFARAEKRGRPPEKMKMGKEVPYSEESIAEGQKLYKALECGKCHGQEGRGDGPSAPTLKDDWRFPIRATDLTRSWNFIGGASREDIYRTLVTGLAGTPMPSFAESFKEYAVIDELRGKMEEGVQLTADEERKLDQAMKQVREKTWHLTNYVRSLSWGKRPEAGVMLKSRLIEGGVPSDPDDPRWEDIEPIEFPLVGQIIVEPRLFTPHIDAVAVKSLHNGKEIAFLLIWDDGTKSSPDQAGGVFDDAIAIQFPAQIPRGPERPYFLMGDSRRAVNLWHWKSSDSSTVTEIDASGLGAQRAQKLGSQETKGASLYRHGQYKLVMRRALTTEDKDSDIQFEVGRFIPIAFLAWDGSNAETGSKMSISSWYYLILEQPASKKRYIYSPIAAFLTLGLQILLMRRVRQNAVGSGR